MTRGDKVRTLFDNGSARGFIRSNHHNGKVFGAEERRNRGLDEIESFLEPCDWFGKVRKRLYLAVFNEGISRSTRPSRTVTHLDNRE